MKKLLLTLFMIPILATAQEKSVVILELFTSQGCSSCPPADVLLNEVSSKDNIIALSYHVDYWNYIGWKDPFSNPKFSDKQRRYSRKFNSSSIYTPQVVVNGEEHFVGSNRTIMKSKIKDYANKENRNSIAVSNIHKEEALISFDYNVAGAIEDTYINVILVLNEKTTQVKRGENRNRTLKNTNIVVAQNILKLNNNQGRGTMIIPEFVDQNDKLSLVVLTENSNLSVTGGTKTNL